jgi:hypothetical protein
MQIGRGELYRSAGVECGVSLWLRYQVRNLDGTPCVHSYGGPGFDNGERILVGRADSCSLAEYLVDAEPTAESREEYLGALARLGQARRTFPTRASEAFQEGWRDADRALANETPAEKRSRIAARRG